MNKSYQPHEAHIPYLLQLFIDYNLYGMNLINLAAVKFRKARRKSKVFVSQDQITVVKAENYHFEQNVTSCQTFAMVFG